MTRSAFLCVCRRQHHKHSLLRVLQHQNGTDESVWPPAVVLLSVTTCSHTGLKPLRILISCVFICKVKLWFPMVSFSSSLFLFIHLSLQPDVHPGNCWAFKGSYGYLVIGLSMKIVPTAFSLDHTPKSLSPTGNISSAPRDFNVYVSTHNIIVQIISGFLHLSNEYINE